MSGSPRWLPTWRWRCGGLGSAVGLLDADIYGPSQQLMMGCTDKPMVSPEEKILPVDGHGVKVMSLGFLMDADTPVIWRGPMVMKALQQFLEDVDWGTLDYLIVDLPPGTGDAQLTMTQQVPLDGAVIVTTPQDVALIDARKGLAMFRKVNVPVLGVIENMSAFVCPHCGKTSEIFKHGGGRRTAEQLGVPFLGEIPIDPAIVVGWRCRHAYRRLAPGVRSRRRRSWRWRPRSRSSSRGADARRTPFGGRTRQSGLAPVPASLQCLRRLACRRRLAWA